MHQSKHLWRGLFFILLITALCGGLALPVVSTPVRAAPQMQAASHIVISQVYGGGGNTGATFKNDFIELFNRGTTPVDLTGWSVQYASAGSTTWTDRTNLSGSIAPGQYYLIQEAAGSGGTIDLPTPDATGNIAMSATAGKVALVNTTTALSGSGCPLVAGIIDFIGYGSGTNCSEVTAAPAPSATTADLRNGNGCSDTNNNNADFVTGTPTPRNSASAPNPCASITVTNVTSSVLDATYTTGAVIDITITFSGQVNVTGSPTLLLETGVLDKPATYASGNGTTTLVFNYTVGVGDSSADLDYVAINSLSGGTITGTSGEAILTLPSPGSTGSLGANKAIVIDTPPSLISFSRQTPTSQVTNADSLVFRVTFSEAVENVDAADFVAAGTTGTPAVVTPVNTSVYDVTISGGDLSNLNGPVGLNLSVTPPATITDPAGNPLPITEPTTDETYTLDNVAPTVTVNQATGQPDPATALPISFAVVFSETINASTFTADDITQATNATATGITWTVTNSGDNRNFTLRATAVTGAGTLVPIIPAGRVTDLAGNNNLASTSSDNSVTFNDAPPTGSATSVVISEFRTRGPGGADDEFVDIYNPTTSPVDISGWIISASNKEGAVQNRATIPASTLLRSGQYYLIAHNNYVVPTSGPGAGISPNLRYGTAISDDGGVAILNATGVIIDEVGMHDNSFYQEGTHLSPLTSNNNRSYERKAGDAADSCVDTDNNQSDFSEDTSSSLHNYSSPLSLCGTTRSAPAATTTLITGDTPDPSAINGNVTVSVRVTGGTTTPSGFVSITGANTNCTITLNATGTGSCVVKFTSNGAKTLTAIYLGDNTHASSSDTEPHQVGTTAANPTPTRQPTPLPPPPLIGINEFVPRPGHDWNNDGVINTGDEYIELINHGVIDVDLSGYSLDDEVNIGSAPYRLPSIILKPGERRVFYGSETGLLLSDGGDGVRLLKPNGQLGDAYNYRVVRFPDQSYCRLPDNGGLDDWNQNCFPTPGLQNSLSGSTVNPPTSGEAENLCPIADTLPADFVYAECSPFGNNIWNAAYWDRNGWYGERFLPQSPGKWNVFVD